MLKSLRKRKASFIEGEREIELLTLKCRLLFDHARDVILFVRENGRIVDANRSALETYGYTHRELTSMSVFDLRSSDNQDCVLDQMRRAGDNGIVFEATLRTKDGRMIPVEVSSTGVDFFGEKILMSIVRDVSSKRRYLEHIERLAYYDELTGIPNRKNFRDSLRRRIAEGEPFSLMLLDVDRFKDVNDTYDHSVGDGLLSALTLSIAKVLEDWGTLYRLGGDEFTILTPESRTERLEALAERICFGTNATFTVQGNPIRSSVSVGVSRYPADARDESLLLKRADLAMYRVKNAGRNSYALFSRN